MMAAAAVRVSSAQAILPWDTQSKIGHVKVEDPSEEVATREKEMVRVMTDETKILGEGGHSELEQGVKKV